MVELISSTSSLFLEYSANKKYPISCGAGQVKLKSYPFIVYKKKQKVKKLNFNT